MRRKQLALAASFIGLLLDLVLQSLACGKSGNLACCDLDGFAGCGVLTGSGSSFLNGEGTKANDLNLFACLKGVLNGVNNCGQCHVGIFLGHFALCYDCIDHPNRHPRRGRTEEYRP